VTPNRGCRFRSGCKARSSDGGGPAGEPPRPSPSPSEPSRAGSPGCSLHEDAISTGWPKSSVSGPRSPRRTNAPGGLGRPGVEREARRELADRDGAAGETQVAIETEPRIVGQRLVDLERLRLAKTSRTIAWVLPDGSRMTARNHRGRTPITATSLALTMTEKRPISCAVNVIGSVAATSTPPGTSMAHASSPMRGRSNTSAGGTGRPASNSTSSVAGSFPA